MAKKFMYVCIGVMALAVTFHIGAEYGKAGYVDHSTTGVIGFQGDDPISPVVLMDSGELYQWRGDEWVLYYHQLPVPASHVKFWDVSHGSYELSFVTSDNEVWGAGVNLGVPPAGPTPIESSTWGKIKAKWGE